MQTGFKGLAISDLSYLTKTIYHLLTNIAELSLILFIKFI